MKGYSRSCLIATLLISFNQIFSEASTFPSSDVLGVLPTFSITGESALVDKETGRIFWESGSSSTLSSSVGPKLKMHLGIRHMKASVISAILFLALAGSLSKWLGEKIVSNPLFSTKQQLSRLEHAVSLSILIIHWLMLRVPKFDKWFVISIMFLYLLEAYFSDTKRYLANSIPADEIKAYVEDLRTVAPVVQWKVRSFHYETRAWFSPIFGILNGTNTILQRLVKDQAKNSTSVADLLQDASNERGVNAPSWLRRKKVTKVALGSYHYKECSDRTLGGTLRRAKSAEKNSPDAPFIKIVLNKLLVLCDPKTRQDYFAQQSQFVADHIQDDQMAEFSTNIVIDGYRPRLLVVRQGSSLVSSFFRLHVFWLFTLLGMSLPYRIWFSNHCDEVRVTVTKEASSLSPSEVASGGLRWFNSRSKIPVDMERTAFRDFFEHLNISTEKEPVDQEQEDGIGNILQTAETALALAETQRSETVSADVEEPNKKA